MVITLLIQVSYTQNILNKKDTVICKGAKIISPSEYIINLDVYLHIKHIYVGPDIIPDEIPQGYVPDPNNYDWGYYYRIAVVGWERVDMIYLEKINYQDSEGIVRDLSSVVRINPVDMFLPPENYWIPFYIKDILWYDSNNIKIISSEGEYTLKIDKLFNCLLNNVK